MTTFRTPLGQTWFNQKYAHGPDCLTWEALADTLVEDVCRDMLSKDTKREIKQAIIQFKMIPAGRYLRNAGRELKYFSNCFALRAEEDTREDWAELSKRVELCLGSGGGIGGDYSVYRKRNSYLKRTGGVASGPVSKMKITNEQGRELMQGGARRSAIYGSLKWNHGDEQELLHVKDWDQIRVPGTNLSLAQVKASPDGFNFPAPLDFTNISLNYDDEWLALPDRQLHPIFVDNVRQAMKRGEPGFSFNFGSKSRETLRNACVPGETLILTSQGYKRIDQCQEVEVWNGTTFSKTKPFKTGIRDLVEVNFDDGTSLVCSPDHKFVLAEGTPIGFYRTEEVRKTADELRPGERLAKHDMPVIAHGSDNDLPHAYSHGFYCGDGTSDLTLSYVHFPKFPVEKHLKGQIKPGPHPERFHVWHHEHMSKTAVPLQASLTYRLEWLAGLLDGDGCVTEDKNGHGLQLVSVNPKFLRDLRLMLTTLGVKAKVVHAADAAFRLMPDGKGGEKEYWCLKSERLLIGNSDTAKLMSLGLTCHRLRLDGRKPQRDARRFVRVVSVVDLDRCEETYCFTEPLANKGTFNGIVTGQCCEFTSEDDSDSCNLATVCMQNIDAIDEFDDVCYLTSLFLICGTVVGDTPYEKVAKVRKQNRRIGVGLMGMHEWLLMRNYRYEVVPELHRWLEVYKNSTTEAAYFLADKLGLARPKGIRAIAPNGTIGGGIAGTTTGIELIYAVAMKRRYLKNGADWVYQYVIDSCAQGMIDRYGLDPENIETAISMAAEPERRIKFQADVQDYVDMAISSTINLPAWTEATEEQVPVFAEILSRYAPRLRGATFYPDGSRGGQPLTAVPYATAKAMEGVEIQEFDSCTIGKGGVCGS